MHVLIFLPCISILFKVKVSSLTHITPTWSLLQRVIDPSSNFLCPLVTFSSGSIFLLNYNHRTHEKPNLWRAWSQGSRRHFKQSALCLGINTSPSDNTTPKTSCHTMFNYVNHAICWKGSNGNCNFSCQSAGEKKIHQVQLGSHETEAWEKQKIPHGVDPNTYV